MLHAREVVCTVTVDLRENPYENAGSSICFTWDVIPYAG